MALLDYKSSVELLGEQNRSSFAALQPGPIT